MHQKTACLLLYCAVLDWVAPVMWTFFPPFFPLNYLSNFLLEFFLIFSFVFSF